LYILPKIIINVISGHTLSCVCMDSDEGLTNANSERGKRKKKFELIDNATYFQEKV